MADFDLIAPRDRTVGSATVRRLLPVRHRRHVGPVVFLDLMGPEVVPAGHGVDVPEHPHIGLSTLTYLLDGRVIHRDSTGERQLIEPGAVNWMTAGSGVTHVEQSHPDDIDRSVGFHGVQIWVALPEGDEDGEPFFAHVGQPDLPPVRSGPASGRLIAGTSWGQTSPVPVSSPMVLADLELDGSGTLALDDEHRDRAVLVLGGEIDANGEQIPEGHLAVFDSGARALIRGTGRLLLIGGEPLGERHISWNFVHSDRTKIDEAHARWEAGEFARTVV